MTRRWILGVALATSACFSPTKIDSSDETSGGTGPSTSTDPSATTVSTTASTSTGDTGDTDDPTTVGCEDECDAEGSVCDGDAIAQCSVGPEGCLSLDVIPCPSGCDAGACLGEPPDLAISIVSAVWLQTDLQVTYVVANLGAGASADYRVDLWADRPGGFDGPPSVGDIGNTAVAKPGLRPGEATQFTDAIPMAPNGRHVAFAIVDADASVAETDENNNVSLGFAWTNTAGETHTSFGAPQAPLAIPDDGTPLETGLDVAAVVGAPLSWMSLNVSHPDVSELRIELVAPNGSARVLADSFEAGVDLGGTTFRDGAGTLLADGVAPYVGEFEPATPWDAEPSFVGTWTLRITDTVAGNAGRVNDWSVSIFE